MSKLIRRKAPCTLCLSVFRFFKYTVYVMRVFRKFQTCKRYVCILIFPNKKPHISAKDMGFGLVCTTGVTLMLTKHYQTHVSKLRQKPTKLDLEIIDYYFNTPKATIKSCFTRYKVRRGKPLAHYSMLLKGLMKNTPESEVLLQVAPKLSKSRPMTDEEFNKAIYEIYGSEKDEYTNRVRSNLKYTDRRNLKQRIQRYVEAQGLKVNIRDSHIPLSVEAEDLVRISEQSQELIRLLRNTIQSELGLSEGEAKAFAIRMVEHTDGVASVVQKDLSRTLKQLEQTRSASAHNAAFYESLKLGSPEPTE